MRETYKDLTEYETDIVVCPDSKKTLRKHLESVIEQEDRGDEVVKGKWEVERLKSVYRTADSLHSLLAPPPDGNSKVCPKLFEAGSINT